MVLHQRSDSIREPWVSGLTAGLGKKHRACGGVKGLNTRESRSKHRCPFPEQNQESNRPLAPAHLGCAPLLPMPGLQDHITAPTPGGSTFVRPAGGCQPSTPPSQPPSGPCSSRGRAHRTPLERAGVSGSADHRGLAIPRLCAHHHHSPQPHKRKHDHGT